MSDALPPPMVPWSDADIRRFGLRVALFGRRGFGEAAAEALAERLARRDQERDPRRMCVECANLQRSGHCFAAAQGRIPMAARRLEPIRDLLQRCEFFQWAMP